MGYRTKLQLIQRKNSEQWYIFLPMAIARAMKFSKSEEVELTIESRDEILLKRIRPRAARRNK